MYKKILALLLVTIMTVSLAACGASNADTKQDSNVVNSETITTNEDAVAFVESCIGFPVQDGFLMIDECEQFLLDKGFEITEQDERSYMD